MSAAPPVREIGTTRPLGGAASLLRSAEMPWRGLLVLGGLAAAAVPAIWVDPAASAAFEPDLARLLRGMALLKATFVLAAVGVLLWRLGQPISTPTALVYLGGTWAGAAATTMIWHLDRLVLASTIFHLGMIVCLVVAMRDGALPASQIPRG